MLSLLHLRTFMAVTKCGNFTKAATFLNLTQPAISGHIAALEQELGTQLFNRTGKKLVLTDAGNILERRARDILRRVDEVKSEIEDLKNLRGGCIRIGASKIIGVYILPKILTAFREQFPDIELQISIHSARTIVAQVEDNQYDLAIVGEGITINPRNIGHKIIGEDELIVIAAPNHPLVKNPLVPLDTAFHEPFILSGQDTASLKHVKQHLSELGIELKSTIEIDEAGAIKRAVEEGAGLAIISRSVVDRELQEVRLVSLHLEKQVKRNILMIWRHDRRFSKNTEAFMQFLQKSITALPLSGKDLN